MAGQFYGVTVYDHDGAIVTIEPDMLAGRDIGAREQAAICAAIEQLRGFMGLPTPPSAGDLLITMAVPLLNAAPDLLAAARHAFVLLEAIGERVNRGERDFGRDYHEERNALRAAIAKAEGR